MANVFYPYGKQALLDNTINPLTDTIKVMLLTSSYTPSNTHRYKSDISNEVSGTGYTAGGQTITGLTTGIDTTSNVVNLTSPNDITWSTATITARYALVYKDTGTPSTSPIISLHDFGSDQSKVAQDFVLSIKQGITGGIIALA